LGVLTDFYEKFCSLFEDTGDSLGNGDDIVGKATELKNSIDELQDFTDSVDSSPLQSLKNQLPDNVGVTPHSWVFSCMVFQQRIEIQMPDIPYAATFRNFLSGLFIAMTAVYAVMIIIKNVREFA
jgi:hypothetical protein